MPYFPKNSNLKGMIELILQITLIINGLFLSRVGVVYICSPLMARPTETVGQERRILSLRKSSPGPLNGLRLMLTTKLGINFSHLVYFASNAASCKIHQCQSFQRPRVEVQSQWEYKNEVLDGPGLDLLHILVPLYGGSIFTIGIFNLTALFLFEIKESSCVLLASGICFWLGTIFVRSTFSKKTLNHYKKGKKKYLDLLHALVGLACLLAGILGCTCA